MNTVETSERTRRQAVEQAMRLCGDDSFVAQISRHSPGTIEGRAAVGRFLYSNHVTLHDGDPLLAYAGASKPICAQWRERCGGGDDTLFAELEFCAQMSGELIDIDCDLYERLCEMRDSLSAQMSQ